MLTERVTGARAEHTIGISRADDRLRARRHAPRARRPAAAPLRAQRRRARPRGNPAHRASPAPVVSVTRARSAGRRDASPLRPRSRAPSPRASGRRPGSGREGFPLRARGLSSPASSAPSSRFGEAQVRHHGSIRGKRSGPTILEQRDGRGIHRGGSSLPRAPGAGSPARSPCGYRRRTCSPRGAGARLRRGCGAGPPDREPRLRRGR